MKKITLITILTVAALLVFAGLAMAAPGNYPPDTTSVYWQVYGEDPVNGRLALVDYFGVDYLMLNPRAKDTAAFANPYTVVNANRSGEVVAGKFDGGYRRAVGTQFVHTEFQKNTNSCASCHMTHTAKGDQLLFRAGIYATCSACHDGSGIGYFNVFLPSEEAVTDRNMMPTGHTRAATNNTIYFSNRVSGTFGVDRAHNASAHLPTGDVTISAAPGGNRNGKYWDGTDVEAKNKDDWGKDFTCASCHAPHGSHSFRLLHYNPNNLAQRTSKSGGLKLEVQAVVYDAGTGRFNIPSASAPWLYGYKSTYESGSRKSVYYMNIYNTDAPATQLTDKFKINYKDGYMKIKNASDLATMVAAVSANKLKADVPRVLVVDGPYVKDGAGLTVPFDAPPAGSSFFADIAAWGKGYQVGNRVVYKNGLNYNIYCAACHTDYERELTARDTFGFAPGMQDLPIPPALPSSSDYNKDWPGWAAWEAHSLLAHIDRNNYAAGDGGTRDYRNALVGEAFGANALTGLFSKAHRHTTWRGATSGNTMEVVAYTRTSSGVDSFNIMCVSCHFVHGTDSLIMKTADEVVIGTNVGTIAANSDINPSSAIKRYTNMAVCWKCHTESRAQVFKNTKYFWTQMGDQSTTQDGFGYNW